MKYIQYHGVWGLEELYDLKNGPDEMHNLINDARWLETKIALRKALFRQLANDKGAHVLPYTEKTSPGLVQPRSALCLDHVHGARPARCGRGNR